MVKRKYEELSTRVCMLYSCSFKLYLFGILIFDSEKGVLMNILYDYYYDGSFVSVFFSILTVVCLFALIYLIKYSVKNIKKMVLICQISYGCVLLRLLLQ